MTPGGLYLRFRQWSEHGLRVAWYRDAVRPRILRMPTVEGLTDGACELHVMTSRQDWLNLVWALMSFYHYSARRYRLCIHTDGSVPAEGIDHLGRLFPDARVISRADADRRVLAELAGHPRCLEFRRTNLLAPKVFDFASYLEGERMLLFDSDLLFFAQPTAMLTRIEDPNYRLNAANRDPASAYTIDPAVVKERLGVDLIPRFNSGLGLIHKGSMRLDWIEEFLGLPGILGHFWRIEQTLFALCSSRWGVEHLPEEYDVRFVSDNQGLPCRHYIGAIRHLMYGQGIRQLLRAGMLK